MKNHLAQYSSSRSLSFGLQQALAGVLSRDLNTATIHGHRRRHKLAYKGAVELTQRQPIRAHVCFPVHFSRPQCSPAREPRGHGRAASGCDCCAAGVPTSDGTQADTARAYGGHKASLRAGATLAQICERSLIEHQLAACHFKFLNFCKQSCLPARGRVETP